MNISTNPCYIDEPNKNGVNVEYWLYKVPITNRRAVYEDPVDKRMIYDGPSFCGCFKYRDEAETFIHEQQNGEYYEIREVTTNRAFLK